MLTFCEVSLDWKQLQTLKYIGFARVHKSTFSCKPLVIIVRVLSLKFFKGMVCFVRLSAVQYSIFKVAYLFRMLAACDFSHSVERVNIWQCLGGHSQTHHNPLASAGHPGHHLGILDSDAGGGDLNHSRLVPLPTSVGTKKNNITCGLKT